jgi:hypothetical protein
LSYRFAKQMRRSSSNLVMVWWFLAELCPFHFENNMKFSDYVHYLPKSVSNSTQICHVDLPNKCAGQVRIWLWFDDFRQSYVTFNLKILNNFQLSFLISSRVLHIQHKFDILWIRQRNAQVKFEFCDGSMVRRSYTPLTLKKENSVHIHYLLYIFNSN